MGLRLPSLRRVSGYPWAGASEIGGRSRNEDSWGAAPLGGGGSLVVIADGLGGHRDGRLASSRAVKAAVAVARKHRGDDLPTLVRAVVAAARRAVIDARTERRSDMDSTLAAVALAGGRAAWAHCGDSRIYRIVGPTVTRLTIDHSLAMSLIAEADRATANTRDDPRRNSLLSTLGSASPMVDFGAGSADNGAFVLCTDGFWEVLPEEALLAADTARPSSAVAEIMGRWRVASAPDSDNATLAIVGRAM